MMAFRTRCNFAIFVGPLVLLSSILIATHGIPRGLNVNRWTVLTGIGLVLSYLTMGIACARMEKHSWDQCNKWRETIVLLSNDVAITKEHLVCKYEIGLGYGVTYAAMIVAFICVVYLTTHLSIAASAGGG